MYINEKSRIAELFPETFSLSIPFLFLSSFWGILLRVQSWTPWHTKWNILGFLFFFLRCTWLDWPLWADWVPQFSKRLLPRWWATRGMLHRLLWSHTCQGVWCWWSVRFFSPGCSEAFFWRWHWTIWKLSTTSLLQWVSLCRSRRARDLRASSRR